MAQQITELAAKAAHLSSTLGTHTGESKNQFPQMIFDFHTQVMVLRPTHMHTNTQTCMHIHTEIICN